MAKNEFEALGELVNSARLGMLEWFTVKELQAELRKRGKTVSKKGVK